MLTPEQIQTLHQLYYAEHWPIRKIERHLRVGWRTIKKYLQQPDQPGISRSKPSKLDPFKDTIADLLAQDPTVNSAVIEQRLRALGYTGGHSILREYVATVRPKPTPRAFVRMEPIAGERCEVDWGHFGVRWITAATSANSTPSPWWNATAACCIWNSHTARTSRLSSAATSTPFRRWAA